MMTEKDHHRLELTYATAHHGSLTLNDGMLFGALKIDECCIFSWCFGTDKPDATGYRAAAWKRWKATQS